MSFLKQFATPLQIATTVLLYSQFSVLGGIAATPGLGIVCFAFARSDQWPVIFRLFILGVLLFLAYFSYTICVLFVVGFFRFISRARAPLGKFPLYSMTTLRWVSYNALILLVRFTCMHFIRGTPFLVLFHRMMGMRMGQRVQLNTSVIADSNLIEIGDDTVIGGDATVIAHSVERGVLITEPVRIGKRVTVGLMAVIMPGCEIGDDAVIAANAVLKKGTKIGTKEVWGGVPAQRIIK